MLGQLAMYDAHPLTIEFSATRPKNLIRLGEDLLRAFSATRLHGISSIHQYQSLYTRLEEGSEYISLISDLIPKGGSTLTRLSSTEAAALAETFNKVVLALSSPTQRHLWSDLWIRLYTHALLRDSRIFPNVELCDESPDYAPTGLTDIWKGDRHGELVCIEAIRTRDPVQLREIESIFRRVVGRDRHPNVLPVIEVSETLFPFCVLVPWMLDGNIIQYTQMNPNADRLILLAQACQGLMYLHPLGILHGRVTPNNILIARDGQARLGDFGLADVFKDPGYNPKLETIRYMAPEWFLGKCFTESDVYSLSMTSFSVLTGILPYDDGDYDTIARRVGQGERPSRPRSRNQNQSLQYPVWDAITTGWSHKRDQRRGLSVVYQVFLTASQQVQNVKVPDTEAGVQQRGKILPRITSFFEFLRDSGSELQRRVNEMDKRLEDHAMPDHDRLKLFNKLCKTCSRNRVIPKSMHIPDCSEGSVEVECGGFANVSQSTYEGRRVAIKAVRVYVTSDLDVILSRFCREGVAWKHLRHPNILPLLGVTVSEHRFALVSEWMENGNINEFIERDRHVNRAELLSGVASGLRYMHDIHVVHGDLKGANILINGDRRACIADFGLSTVTGVATRAATRTSRSSLISNDTLMSFTGGGTRRWMSPELLDPERFGMPESEDNRPTRQSDCYALGMVIYEVLCGHHPYLEIPSDILAVHAIMEGVRPKKPEAAKQLGFSNELWRMIELCWLEDRNARPGVGDIHSCLNDAAAFWYMKDF